MKRVKIGRNYQQAPSWKLIIGLPLSYFPIFLTLPFVFISIVFIKTHLEMMGAVNVKSYWKDFVPDWVTHRYNLENQIVGDKNTRFLLAKQRWFWIFNCKIYCPLSVAAFRYMAYLIMIVENWWCPFHHNKKCDYSEAAIDQSFWHIYPQEMSKLSPEDRDNPIWNNKMDHQDLSISQKYKHTL